MCMPCFVLLRQFLYVALADLVFLILLPLSTDCWNYIYVLPHQDYGVFSCSFYLLMWQYEELRIINKFIKKFKIFIRVLTCVQAYVLVCVCVYMSVGTCRG